MPDTPFEFMELFDVKGNLFSVQISADLWTKVKVQVEPLLYEALGTKPDSIPPVDDKPEPMNDFALLLEYWDFAYPPTYDVACELCGASTDDWRADEPRKFILKAANIGGLVNFQCQNCNARVIKRYFKKHASTECRPFIEK